MILLGCFAGLIFVASTTVSLGIISIGMIIVATIELARHRFQSEPIPIAIVTISSMSLIWGWIGPQIGNFEPFLPPSLFLLWGVYCLSSAKGQLQLRLRISGILCMGLTILIAILPIKKILAPLLWGYDNSGHVPALAAIYHHGGFIYSGWVPDLFTSNMFKGGYPVGQSTSWAFVMSVVNVSVTGGYEIVRFFSLFILLMGSYLVYILTKAVIPRTLVGTNHQVLSFLVSIFLASAIIFSQVGTIFWYGYPPFVWACILIFSISKISELTTSLQHKIMLDILGLVLVTYAYPILSPVPLMSLLFTLCKIKTSDFPLIIKKLPSILICGGVGLILIILVVLKSLVVRHWIYSQAWIEPVNNKTIFAILISVLAVMSTLRLNYRNIPNSIVIFIASTINYVILAYYSSQAKSEITYYPQKAGYLALMSGVIALGTVINLPVKFKNPMAIRFRALLLPILALGILLYSANLSFQPNKFGAPTTHAIINYLKNNQPNKSWSCLNRAMDLTSDLNSIDDTQTLVLIQKDIDNDLTTRWLNGARGRLNDPTYSLAIPIGQNQQPLEQIFDFWFKLYTKSKVVILAPQIPDGLGAWSDRIEFRYLDCSV